MIKADKGAFIRIAQVSRGGAVFQENETSSIGKFFDRSCGFKKPPIQA